MQSLSRTPRLSFAMLWGPLCLLHLALGAGVHAAQETPTSVGAVATQGPLHALEARLQEVSVSAAAATVGLSVDGLGGMASGVIVDPAGWVLTVGHALGSPFQRCTLTLADGREVGGVTLGKNGRADMGLVRILEEGEWPWVPLGDPDQLRRGEACLVVGHPGGVAPQRPPVVRLGSVERTRGKFLRTSGRIQPGDSGGGLFDLSGRLVGIASRIEVAPEINDFVPIDRFRRDWARLASGEVWSPDPHLPDLSSDRGPAPGLADSGVDDGEPPPLGPPLADPSAPGAELRALLQDSFQPLAAELAPQIVLLRGQVGGEEMECLATVVDSEGLLLSKASVLTEPLSAFLRDGRVLPATILVSDMESDLALVSVPATDLEPVSWAPGVQLQPGQLVGAPGSGADDLSLGVVSVGARVIPSRGPGYFGIVLGQDAGRGAVVREVQAGTGAQRAGFQAGDLVVSVEGREVRGGSELIGLLHRYVPGVTVEVELLRGEERVSVEVILGSRPDLDTRALFHAADQVAVSDRRDRFPSAVRHDLDLSPERCGGPLVDSQGRVVGLNIARVDRVGSLALPAAIVVEVLAELRERAGRPARRRRAI